MTFSSLGLVPTLQETVATLGYDTPTPIQAQAIPEILAGRDLMAAAQTGTGKTAGFALPLLQRLLEGKPAHHGKVRALILTPTRELASQVAESVRDYSRDLDLRSAVVFGGVKIGPQISRVQQGVDVLTATPGRLLDLHQQGVIDFGDLEVLVLDEADRMLDMGFIRDIRKILALLPQQRQNLLFSATFSSEIRKLAQGILHQPVSVEVTPRNATADTVRQWVHPVSKRGKTALLCHLFQAESWQQVLVFTRTKHGANRLAQKLDRAGISAAVIHGNKSQNARTRALADFKACKVRALVATDIAARGLDIAELPQVVNFELPNVAEDYVHRIGRTGRAGVEGQAVSLVSGDEEKLLRGIERLIGQKLEQRVIEGFDAMAEDEREEEPRDVRSGERAEGARAPSDKPARRRRRRSNRSARETEARNEAAASAPAETERKRSGEAKSAGERGRRGGGKNRRTANTNANANPNPNPNTHADDAKRSEKQPKMSEAALHQAKADRDLEEQRRREERRLMNFLQPGQPERGRRNGSSSGRGRKPGKDQAAQQPASVPTSTRKRRRKPKPKQQDWSQGIGPLV